MPAPPPRTPGWSRGLPGRGLWGRRQVVPPRVQPLMTPVLLQGEPLQGESLRRVTWAVVALSRGDLCTHLGLLPSPLPHSGASLAEQFCLG